MLWMLWMLWMLCMNAMHATGNQQSAVKAERNVWLRKMRSLADGHQGRVIDWFEASVFYLFFYFEKLSWSVLAFQEEPAFVLLLYSLYIIRCFVLCFVFVWFCLCLCDNCNPSLSSLSTPSRASITERKRWGGEGRGCLGREVQGYRRSSMVRRSTWVLEQ